MLGAILKGASDQAGDLHMVGDDSMRDTTVHPFEELLLSLLFQLGCLG